MRTQLSNPTSQKVRGIRNNKLRKIPHRKITNLNKIPRIEEINHIKIQSITSAKISRFQ